MSDKFLYAGPWLEVIERDGWYHFARNTTSGGGVYVLVWRQNVAKPVLGRYEVCPAHGDIEPTLTSLTGGVNIQHDPMDVAVQEVFEEAGYIVSRNQMIDLGKVQLTKFTDAIGHLYAVDVTGLERVDAPGDGTQGEVGSYCHWITIEDALFCKCPVFGCLIYRAIKIIPSFSELTEENSYDPT